MQSSRVGGKAAVTPVPIDKAGNFIMHQKERGNPLTSLSLVARVTNSLRYVRLVGRISVA